MSPLGFPGLAIAVDAMMFSNCIFWMGRPARRVEAERAAAYCVMFVFEPLPPHGAEVHVLVDDERGMVAELAASEARSDLERKALERMTFSTAA